MPADHVDEPQVVPWLEKHDLAYYGPFRCVERPRAPPRRQRRKQSQWSLNRFSRAFA